MILFVENDLNDKLPINTVIDNFVVMGPRRLNYNN